MSSVDKTESWSDGGRVMNLWWGKIRVGCKGRPCLIGEFAYARWFLIIKTPRPPNSFRSSFCFLPFHYGPPMYHNPVLAFLDHQCPSKYIIDSYIPVQVPFPFFGSLSCSTSFATPPFHLISANHAVDYPNHQQARVHQSNVIDSTHQNQKE